jgi:hypothetical protein
VLIAASGATGPAFGSGWLLLGLALHAARLGRGALAKRLTAR